MLLRFSLIKEATRFGELRGILDSTEFLWRSVLWFEELNCQFGRLEFKIFHVSLREYVFWSSLVLRPVVLCRI